MPKAFIVMPQDADMIGLYNDSRRRLGPQQGDVLSARI